MICGPYALLLFLKQSYYNVVREMSSENILFPLNNQTALIFFPNINCEGLLEHMFHEINLYHSSNYDRQMFV